MQVIFKRSDGTAEKTIDVLPDSKLGDNREVAQMLLGLPENPPCKLVLERTGEELRDSLTFQQTGINQNDKLILFPLNNFSTNRESKAQDSVSRNTKKKDTQASFNLTGLSPLLVAGGIVLILGIGSLLYLQIRQQTISTELLRRERVQRQEAERKREETQRQLDVEKALYEAELKQARSRQTLEVEKQLEEVKRQLETQQTSTITQFPLGNFSNSTWLVSIWYESNTYYYRGKNLRNGDSLTLAGVETSGDTQRRIYTWKNKGYRYQLTWQINAPYYLRLQVFAPEGKLLLNQLLEKTN